MPQSQGWHFSALNCPPTLISCYRDDALIPPFPEVRQRNGAAAHGPSLLAGWQSPVGCIARHYCIISCPPAQPAIPAPCSHRGSRFLPPKDEFSIRDAHGRAWSLLCKYVWMWELGFKFLLCKERPDLTQERKKKKLNL